MKCPVLSFDGKIQKQVDLPSEIFDVPFKEEILHRAITYQSAKKQTGQHSTKTIAYVSGGGRKPHKQKGTGRARQGSSRSGHMRGGACIFGPQVRSHAIDIPKKMFLLAIKIAISQRLREGRFVIVKNDPIKEIKTKKGSELLKNLKVNKKALLILNSNSVILRKSLKNIPDTMIIPPIAINAYNVIWSSFVVITEDALALMVEKLGQNILFKEEKKSSNQKKEVDKNVSSSSREKSPSVVKEIKNGKV